MGRPRGLWRRPFPEIPIYRLTCKGLEEPEFVSEWKREFDRLFHAKRSDAHRDRDITLVNDPDFPLPAVTLYGGNLYRHL